MKEIALILSVIAVLLPQAVLAETWVQLDDRMIIDADSIIMNGELRAYWMRFALGNSQFSMHRELVDCVTGERATAEVVVYNADGRVADHKTYNPGETSKYIIPGSKGAIVYNYVCRS